MRWNLGTYGIWIMVCVLQVLSGMWVPLCWHVIIKIRKGGLRACLMAGREGSLKPPALDWPYIDRFTKTRDRDVFVVKTLPNVTARGASYIMESG